MHASLTVAEARLQRAEHELVDLQSALHNQVALLQGHRASLPDNVSAEIQRFVDMQASVLSASLAAIEGSESQTRDNLHYIGLKLDQLGQNLTNDSSDLKETLDQQKIATQMCQMHLDLIHNTTLDAKELVIQQASHDTGTDWLDILRTAGLFLGAFAGVSNIIAIQSLKASIQTAPVPERPEQMQLRYERVHREEDFALSTCGDQFTTSSEPRVKYHDFPGDLRNIGHSRAAKPADSIGTTLTALPEELTFCFSIQSITPDYSVQMPLQSGHPDFSWIPLTENLAFEDLGTTGWFYWNNGRVQPVPNFAITPVQEYDTVSMFWCNDRQAFMHVPYDCLEQSVNEAQQQDKPLPWRGLSLHQRACSDGGVVSLVGYQYESDTLGATGPSEWMHELLPDVYQYYGVPHYQGSGRLAGKLSILLGLIAFSRPPEEMFEAIRESFRKTAEGTRYSPHGGVGSGSMCNLDDVSYVTDALQGLTGAAYLSRSEFSQVCRGPRWRLGKRANMDQSYLDCITCLAASSIYLVISTSR